MRIDDDLLPSTLLTVIVAVPIDLPTIKPELLTLTILLFDEDHVRDLFVALVGKTLTDN